MRNFTLVLFTKYYAIQVMEDRMVMEEIRNTYKILVVKSGRSRHR